MSVVTCRVFARWRVLGRAHALDHCRCRGEPTGGNQRGINGGELTWLTLPSSSIAVDIPLIAWMGDGSEPDAGATPDVSAPRTVEDVRAGRDAALLAAQKRFPRSGAQPGLGARSW